MMLRRNILSTAAGKLGKLSRLSSSLQNIQAKINTY
jgi:hypothetical protein